MSSNHFETETMLLMVRKHIDRVAINSYQFHTATTVFLITSHKQAVEVTK